MVTTVGGVQAEGFGGRRGGSPRWVATFTQQATTTPGRMRLLSLLSVVLLLLAAVGALATVSHRLAGVRTVGTDSEPLIVDAQAIDADLSEANSTAANAFLGGGLESVAQRSTYEDSLRAASALVADAAGRSGADRQSVAALRTLTEQIPVYAGLVETARANNRQGYPVGAAYLRQAASLMSSTILPAATGLYSVDAARLAHGNSGARRAGDLALVTLLVLLLIIGLGGAQVWLYRQTRRLFNLPLLGGTLLAVALLLVTGSAMVAEARESARANDTSFASVNVLAQARIAAFKAKGDESLTLIGRGNGGAFEADFASQIATIPGLLAKAHVSDSSLQDYLAVHRRIRALDDGGKFDQAVALAVGGGQSSAANKAFGALDGSLTGALDASQRSFIAHERAAGRRLHGFTAPLVVALLAAAVLTLLGFQQRINEYR